MADNDDYDSKEERERSDENEDGTSNVSVDSPRADEELHDDDDKRETSEEPEEEHIQNSNEQGSHENEGEEDVRENNNEDQYMDVKLETVTRLLQSHINDLKACHLKDYQGLEDLKQLQNDIDVVTVEAGETLSLLAGRLQQVHDKAGLLYRLVDQKLVDEGLLSWANNQSSEKGILKRII